MTPKLKKAYKLLQKAENDLKKALNEGKEYLPTIRTGKNLFRAMDTGLNVVLEHYGIPTDIHPEEKFDRLYEYDKTMAQHYIGLAGIFLAPYGKYGHIESYLLDIETIKAMFKEIEKHLQKQKVK